MIPCRECDRPSARVKLGLCPACYERARYWKNRVPAAEVPPCVLCGQEGPRNRWGTPIRHDGEAWDLAGDLCARCAGSIEAEARGGHGYRWRRRAAERRATP